jgi:hypothetical protein
MQEIGGSGKSWVQVRLLCDLTTFQRETYCRYRLALRTFRVFSSPLVSEPVAQLAVPVHTPAYLRFFP